ncbi:IucA/IucC family protein [Longispora sp. K20-0274]|uniref:IucA/IucC family protein n=1 Tax=Longispora sp. K20-0274 TaxID=3088255 RepID=UPI00399BA82A
MSTPLVELSGARAAVLGRLWGALCREPLPQVVARESVAGETVVTLVDGRRLVGPAEAGVPFAVCRSGLTVTLGGVGYNDPERLAAGLGWPGRVRAELADSVANLALSRTAPPPRLPASAARDLAGGRGTAPGSDAGPGPGATRRNDGGPGPVTGGHPGSGSGSAPGAPTPWYPSDLVDLEARVVDGHPLHPLCRTRTGMSAAEQVRFGPEFSPTVGLELVRVRAADWVGVGDWPWREGADYLLPVHPWQREHVWAGAEVAGSLEARPLMSLRTLVLRDGWHVKTAVSVQMTSAMRTVSAASVRNGPALSALVGSLTGLEVLAEPAAGSVGGDRERAAVLRAGPVAGAGEWVCAVSALCAGPDPLVVGLAGADPVGWVSALVDAVLPPLLALLTVGVALEAHGQNTLVVLRDGRPVRGVYRDFGGVRVSPALLARHRIDCPPLFGDVESDDPAVLRAKFVSSALSTMFAEVVAVLARGTGVSPRLLWWPVAQALSGHPGLVRGPWPMKALMTMRLAADPLEDVWAWVPSPVATL